MAAKSSCFPRRTLGQPSDVRRQKLYTIIMVVIKPAKENPRFPHQKNIHPRPSRLRMAFEPL